MGSQEVYRVGSMEGFCGGGPWRGKIATPHDFYVPDRNKLNNNMGYVMITPRRWDSNWAFGICSIFESLASLPGTCPWHMPLAHAPGTCPWTTTTAMTFSKDSLSKPL